MKRALALALLAVLAACGPRSQGDIPAGRSDTRQQPSTYTPGLHVSGHADIGVIKRF